MCLRGGDSLPLLNRSERWVHRLPSKRHRIYRCDNQVRESHAPQHPHAPPPHHSTVRHTAMWSLAIGGLLPCPGPIWIQRCGCHSWSGGADSDFRHHLRHLQRPSTAFMVTYAEPAFSCAATLLGSWRKCTGMRPIVSSSPWCDFGCQHLVLRHGTYASYCRMILKRAESCCTSRHERGVGYPVEL